MRLSLALVMLTVGAAFADPPKPQNEDAKIDAAKRQLRALTESCKVYKLKYGDFPEKLDQLVNPPQGKPFLEKKDALVDPWGKKYEYDAAGKKNDGLRPDIWTVTPGKKEIGNWPDKK